MSPARRWTRRFRTPGTSTCSNKYKKANPNVKTLVSVGGWAETGGYFDDDGARAVDAGGFYRMTTTSYGTVNTAGINTFADSVGDVPAQYGFNGVDIDYEYPTSNKNAGQPARLRPGRTAKRAGLNASYVVLMKTLREKLDAAAAADGKYYMLTVAAPVVRLAAARHGVVPGRCSTSTTSTSCRTTCTAPGTSTSARTRRSSTTARTASSPPAASTAPTAASAT